MPALFRSAAADLLARARAARRILVTGPREVDGDSLASSLALVRALRERCEAELVVVGEPGWRYAELPGAAELVGPAEVRGPFDVAIVLDGDRRRLDARLGAPFDAAASKVVIDHHESTTPAGYDLAILDRRAAATAELIHRLLRTWGVVLDASLARLLYTGLVYDTGGLRHSNTTPARLRLAAKLIAAGAPHNPVVVRTSCEKRFVGLAVMSCVLGGARLLACGRAVIGTMPAERLESLGADYGDLDLVVDQLLYVLGVEVAVLAVERRTATGLEVKLSLRARSDADVCALAHRMHDSGGGHKRAAGVVLAGGLDQVLEPIVLPAIAAALGTGGGCGGSAG